MSPTFIRLDASEVVHRDQIDGAHFTKNTSGAHAGWLTIRVRGEPGERWYIGEAAVELWRVIAGLSLPSGNYAKDESAATLWKVMQKWLTSLTSITSLGKDK